MMKGMGFLVGCCAALVLVSPVRADSPIELVALWDFEEILTDVVGGREGSTSSGGPFDKDGRFGSALGDGVVRVSDASFMDDLGDQFSISFWQRLFDPDPDQSFYPVFVSSAEVGQLSAIRITMPDGFGAASFDTLGTDGVLHEFWTPPGSTSVAWDEWNHVTLVKDGALKAIYLNGERIGQTEDATPMSSPFRAVAFGSGLRLMRLDECAFFRGALSELQVQALAGGASPFAVSTSTDPDTHLRPFYDFGTYSVTGDPRWFTCDWRTVVSLRFWRFLTFALLKRA